MTVETSAVGTVDLTAALMEPQMVVKWVGHLAELTAAHLVEGSAERRAAH